MVLKVRFKMSIKLKSNTSCFEIDFHFATLGIEIENKERRRLKIKRRPFRGYNGACTYLIEHLSQNISCPKLSDGI